MKISIITCTYNRLEKLKKNIISVRKQKLLNYEHIIIDDGSTDKTEEYIINLNDKNIKYIKLKKNCGQPVALYNSRVFSNLKSDYAVILDSDDYLFDNAFQTFFNHLNKFDDKKILTYNFDFSEK